MLFAVSTPQGCFLTTNAASLSLWGYEPEELIGRCFLVLVPTRKTARGQERRRRDTCLRETEQFREPLCAQGWLDRGCALVRELVGGG